MADLLAKRGTTLVAGPIEDLPIPAVNLKTLLKHTSTRIEVENNVENPQQMQTDQTMVYRT
jgi:hypothetical protein